MKKTILTLLTLVIATFTAHAQLLWKVTGKELTKPSYVLGTFHLADVAFVDSIPGLKEALNASEQVYGELDMRKLLSDPSQVQQMQHAMMLPKDTTLDSLLTIEQMKRLNEFLKQYLGADLTNPMLAPMKQMKPAAISTQIQMVLAMQIAKGFNPQQQFDTYFQNVANEQQKPVGGLETMDYQLGVLYGAPLKRQAELLMCLVDDVDYQKDVLKRTIDAYYKQNLEAVHKVMEEKRHNTCDSTPEEDNILIYTRNANWASALPALMKTRSTFLAVGCAHLPGERGLISLLQKAGYTVTPIK
jgi:uncharacterized protein YbaP (TraB family)